MSQRALCYKVENEDLMAHLQGFKRTSSASVSLVGESCQAEERIV